MPDIVDPTTGGGTVRGDMRTRISPVAFAASLVVAGLLVAGCGRSPRVAAQPAAVPVPALTSASAPASAPASASPAAGASPMTAAVPETCGVWGCAQEGRLAAAAAYVSRQPGDLGIVLHDRNTGAVWRAGDTQHAGWTASTIKVAIAANLLERGRAGRIALNAADRSAMADMLNWSSNDAATALWDKFDGPEMLAGFRTVYGMRGLSVVPGYDVSWRHLRCTAEDLHNLMSYVLDRLYPADRAYLVNALRGVADNQHWGVWAAGPAFLPGNKDGWALKPDNSPDHWVTHSVGFAGPGERYLVAVTYELPASSSLADGVHAVSDLVAMVFGAQTPAAVVVPAG
jgi:hypothetical protein